MILSGFYCRKHTRPAIRGVISEPKFKHYYSLVQTPFGPRRLTCR